MKDHSLANLRKQVGESSTLLSPWLKLYQIHSATLDSGVLDNKEVLDELARLRDGGMLIGLSVTGTKQSSILEKALAIQRGEASLFGSVQATWNLLEPSVGLMLQTAHQAGWLIIIKEGLANGRLTHRGNPSFPATCDQLALSAILQQPWADIVLSGAASLAHLQSNIAAVSLTSPPRLTLNAFAPEEYWQSRSQMQWN